MIIQRETRIPGINVITLQELDTELNINVRIWLLDGPISYQQIVYIFNKEIHPSKSQLYIHIVSK
jgi:hypothetical protein